MATVTEQQRKEMLEAAKPLMKWMAANLHPHCWAMVDSGNVKLLEGLATAGTDEYTVVD